jgi:hypothetical protein
VPGVRDELVSPAPWWASVWDVQIDPAGELGLCPPLADPVGGAAIAVSRAEAEDLSKGVEDLPEGGTGWAEAAPAVAGVEPLALASEVAVEVEPVRPVVVARPGPVALSPELAPVAG